MQQKQCFEKPFMKPVVIRVGKPLPKWYLNPNTIQYNTIRVVFEPHRFSSKTTTLLVSETDKQGFLSCFFFLCCSTKKRLQKCRDAVLHTFSTKFSTFRKNGVQTMRVDENKVPEKRCPYCGEKRPLDWFIAQSEACWRCRAMKRDGVENAKKVRDDELIC